MLKVLQLKTSILDNAEQQGVSSELSDELLTRLRAQYGELELTQRNFSKSPVPYVDQNWLQALMTPAEKRTPQQSEKVAYSDSLIQELEQADILLVGAPMYNFAIPAMLKSWTDHVARAGVTFKYTESGAQGLLKNKRVFVLLSSGGQHEEGVSDFIRPFLRTFFGFLGISAVEFIVAHGLNMGEAPRAAGLAQARAQITQLIEQGEAA